MIDYKGLIDGLRVEKVMELLYSLGARTVENRPECLITNTICHNANPDEASMKLYYYKDRHLFYCYTECGPLGIFEFLKHYYECRGIEYDWYADILTKVLICSSDGVFADDGFQQSNPYSAVKTRYEQRKQRRDLPTYPKGVLDVYSTFFTPEWKADGISVQAMRDYDIKFSPLENKIIIPHFNADGGLVGIRGRTLDPWVAENIGKYMPVQIEQKWYSHPLALNLYGLNKTKDNIRRYGICYLMEGEKSVLQCESFSFPNCAVGVCGSAFNKFQLDLLLRHCAPREIVVCFDKEERPGETRYWEKLRRICERYSPYANFSFVYDRQNLLQMKQSPVDCGETVFRKLIERRVKLY